MTDIERIVAHLTDPPNVLYVRQSTFASGVRTVCVDFWSLLLFPYVARFALDGEEFPIRPGYVALIPPGIKREYFMKEPVSHIGIHFAFAEQVREPLPKPMLFDSGDKFYQLSTRFERAFEFFAVNPTRLNACLWDILWDVVECPLLDASITSVLHPALKKALLRIENQLDQPLFAEEIAANAEISHNQLIRLFRKELDCTIVEYIRKRRMKRVRYLLQSTDMPIKAVAREVGIPDLQHFNHTIHKVFGCSPRSLRHRLRQ